MLAVIWPQYVEKAEDKTVWTYAAVGVLNPGGVRASIDSTNEDITLADLMMAQPFENTWDVLELNGSCILQVSALTCTEKDWKKIRYRSRRWIGN